MAKKSTTEEFVQKARVIHGDKYDYSKVNYKGNHSVVIIICKIHGQFHQLAYSHLAGHGCRKCYDRKKTIRTDEFIRRANKIHKNKYDYSETIYTHSKKRLIIICPTHGKFSQFASAHLEGNGCGKCYWEGHKITSEQFIKRASKKHKNYYDYSYTQYKHPNTKVKIICPQHGEFHQFPFGHLSGQGCKKCTSNISHKEIEFLDCLKIKESYRQQKISRFLVDALDISTNTIYEFLGDYWHGNPSIHFRNDTNKCAKCTFGELYDFTFCYKFKYLKDRGYRIKYVWENEWDEWNKQKIVGKIPIHEY